jgi:tetratricopeptide (TPR) repeat protein
MTEELTATLARIRSLRVISSTSAMYYKGKQKPLREIASELDVDAIVEGSVMRSGGRVRVTAQLVEGGTDRHLWAQSYERDMRDVLALQGEVARAIAGEVKAVLAPAEAARLADARTVNPEAYEHYLAGRHLFARLTKEGLTRALEEFERAIEKDPDYAPAHAGLAMTYLSLADWSVASPREAFRKARAAALRAVEIDPTLAQAQLARAMTKLKVERDWAGAEAALLRAIELSPNDADARSEHAWHLLRLGRMDEALAEAMQAHQLAPLSPYHTLALVTVDGNARRYDEALIQTNRLLDLHPDYGPGKDLLAMLYVEMGRYEEGIQALRDRLEAPDAEVPAVMMYLVRAYALAGKPAQARALLSDLLDLAKRIYVPPNYVAGALGSVGDKERAFEWLGRALEENDPVVLFLKVGPWFDPLRSDPRFADLLRRAGLAEN